MDGWLLRMTERWMDGRMEGEESALWSAWLLVLVLLTCPHLYHHHLRCHNIDSFLLRFFFL